MPDRAQPGEKARPGEKQRQRSNVTARAVRMLEHRLSQGEWAAGDRLPSEPSLAEELGVSRVTVRAALAQLENEGIVNRRHGSGTYVNSVRPLVSSLHLNMGAEQMIRSTGHVPGIAEMSWRQAEADADIADRLAIEVGAPVVHLHRVRTADGVPVTVSDDYFPAAFLPEETVALGPSLYSFLSTVCGIDVSFGIANLEPAIAGPERAAALRVKSDELCLVIRQVDYDVTEQPVSYSVECHLASELTFQLVRQGPSSAPASGNHTRNNGRRPRTQA
ncbi:GntR family transcriptional regulator [Streptomyces sp. LHD-70]|uniref:GntR family transcriptional regulator n=1 Tax=Streptomyces sp. LHD-70 TaxID=3072140 RepID=UPI00280F613C|nr:GntR family transcriptional regulator [Streptomyces sp. LHD-70]MDQ8708077.1 GntR family transcriptional regulator [Streptomyces sp. LHD-70]